MKRDMDLIRSLLLEIEENVPFDRWGTPVHVAGYDDATIGYHIGFSATRSL
jgi:hypothetical protein